MNHVCYSMPLRCWVVIPRRIRPANTFASYHSRDAARLLSRMLNRNTSASNRGLIALGITVPAARAETQ